jgi:hypothetical protein
VLRAGADTARGWRGAAHIPLFLYPFLNTVSKTRPFEYLRLTSLGVIGALVKVRRPPGARRSFHAARAPPHGETRATLPPVTPHCRAPTP